MQDGRTELGGEPPLNTFGGSPARRIYGLWPILESALQSSRQSTSALLQLFRRWQGGYASEPRMPPLMASRPCRQPYGSLKICPEQNVTIIQSGKFSFVQLGRREIDQRDPELRAFLAPQMCRRLNQSHFERGAYKSFQKMPAAGRAVA
jgi:hypothetical protein